MITSKKAYPATSDADIARLYVQVHAIISADVKVARTGGSIYIDSAEGTFGATMEDLAPQPSTGSVKKFFRNLF